MEQAKPDSGVTPGPGSDVKEDPEDPDNPDDPDYDPAKPSVNVGIDGDDVPVGIEPITDSFKVILADGTEVPVPADSYDPATRILAVNMGDVEGGTNVKFVFDAEIGEEALDSDVGNIAKAYGSLPSGIPGDELNNRAQPGSKFTPSQGWPAYEAAHSGISNPDKVYPFAKISAQSKVRPNPDTLGKKLAKTGDDGTLFVGAGVLALVALAMAVFSWRRRQNSF
ncbi:LPXTG cell wall anchor domain-containing protein [Parvibacter caecicola]|uniref:LPXTG cell wall anchor domain-containing protein n=1 Tax=Parvibacter caecicola TaxID=747645 RepID=UPI0023F04BE6|nr:LPXTG cell wall anchor domain-containing protein [Parvibacter caecicola]